MKKSTYKPSVKTKRQEFEIERENRIEPIRAYLYLLCTTVPKWHVKWDDHKTVNFKAHCRNAIKLLNQDLYDGIETDLNQHIKILEFYHHERL